MDGQVPDGCTGEVWGLYKLWSNRFARQGILQLIAVLALSQVESVCLPLAAYQRQQESREYELSFVERLIVRKVPFYYYGAYLAAFEEQEGSEEDLDGRKTDVVVTKRGGGTEIPVTDAESGETSKLSVTDVENGGILTPSETGAEQREASKPSGTDAEQEEPQDTLQSGYLEQMLRENTAYRDADGDGQAGADRQGSAETEELSGTQQAHQTEIAENTDRTDETREWESGSDFVIPYEPSYTYNWEQTWTEDDLRSEFFAVDSSTSMKEEYLDAEALLSRDLTIEAAGERMGQDAAETAEGQGAEDDSAEPQILIYHTHASEAFADSVPGDPSTTIVGAGDRLAALLEGYGFRVLHHTGVYDTERDVAYDKALPALTELLEENPSIEVVIDLHRDEMAGERRLVMDLQGRPTARFMFFNGLSYLRKKGDISYLENPYIMDNLAFSFQAQVLANEYYPGLTRKIYLKAYRYNMHLCPKSMLIELGAQNNTVEEIMNACDPLAHVLAMTLKKL